MSSVNPSKMKVVSVVWFFILDYCLLPNLPETVKKTLEEELQSPGHFLTSREVNPKVIPIQLVSREENIMHAKV